MRICIFEAEILLEPGDEDYISCALNFMTFGNTSQKLWPNMLLFSVTGQSEQIRKKHFFKNKTLKLPF